jgi:hypothetical protein
MAENSDPRGGPSDNADWMFLALTPLVIAATMLVTAAVFVGSDAETPAAAATPAQTVIVGQN